MNAISTTPAPPPSQGLDRERAAKLLGWTQATDRDGELRRTLDAAPQAERVAFLRDLARGDPLLLASFAAGRWRATGATDDLRVASAWAWRAFLPEAAAVFRLPPPPPADPDALKALRRIAAGFARGGLSGAALGGAIEAAAARLRCSAEAAAVTRWAARITQREASHAA